MSHVGPFSLLRDCRLLPFPFSSFSYVPTLFIGHSRPLFLYFWLYNTVDSTCSIKMFADDCIRTTDLWNRKRQLYQLCHNHCHLGPDSFFPPVNPLKNRSVCLFKNNTPTLVAVKDCTNAHLAAPTAYLQVASITKSFDHDRQQPWFMSRFKATLHRRSITKCLPTY